MLVLMPLVDRIVAVALLGSLSGAVTWKAWRAWREYRIQQRALHLLTRSVTEADGPRREAPTP
jgi:hypothetical protein